MNRIIDVRVEMHGDIDLKPEIYCLFDEINTDCLVFKMAGTNCSDDFKKRVLMQTMVISGINLLAINNDLAQWFYFAPCVGSGCPQKILKIQSGDEISEISFDGLWLNNAGAINLWFPETLVMRIRGTSSRCEFDVFGGAPMAAVAAPVISHLHAAGWKAGLVKGLDGYIDVEPLMPDGTPKSAKAKVIRQLNPDPHHKIYFWNPVDF